MNPEFSMTMSKINEKDQNEFFCPETHRELILDEVKKLLIQVCSKEEHFTTKFEVAPLGRSSQLTFLIKVNNSQVFEKTVTELIQFCSDMNVWADGKN